MKQLTLTTQLANASLPRHKKQLQQQYGALADAVLAEAVSGRAWGLPAVSNIYVHCVCTFHPYMIVSTRNPNPKPEMQVEGYTYGASHSPWKGAGDVTALGWAQLIRLYALRERDVAAASVAAAAETEDDEDEDEEDEVEKEEDGEEAEGCAPEVRTRKMQDRHDVHGDAYAREPAGAAASSSGATSEVQTGL